MIWSREQRMNSRRMVMLRQLFSNHFDTSALCSSQLYNNETFYRAFTSDLRYARKSVYIESPFITTRRMDSLLPMFAWLRARGIRVTINTRCPDEHEGEYLAQAHQAVGAMQSIGITVLFTIKHHRKLAIIDDEILWEGSLNILSHYDSCEVMRRSYSQALVMQMVQFVGVNKWI